MSPSPDLRLFVAGVRRETSYRLAIVAGVLSNSVFGFIRVAIFGAVVTAAAGPSGTLAGYSATGIVTFTWLSQALIGPLRIWGTRDLAERVRSGDVAVDLARPLPLLRAHVAHDLGRCTASILPRSAPILLVAAVTTGLHLTRDPALLTLGLVAVALGVLVSSLSRYALQLAAFWIVEMRGVLSLYQAVSGLLAGLVFPVALMPGWLRTIAHATPFPAMLQIPADILTGVPDPARAARLVVVQLAWALGLFAFGTALTHAGHRHLVVQGG